MRIDQIVKLAATVDAPRLAIAHNHPDGNPTPSPEDLALTAGLKEALKLINKELEYEAQKKAEIEEYLKRFE